MATVDLRTEESVGDCQIVFAYEQAPDGSPTVIIELHKDDDKISAVVTDIDEFSLLVMRARRVLSFARFEQDVFRYQQDKPNPPTDKEPDL